MFYAMKSLLGGDVESAWPVRVWFNGRTKASQALDEGSIPSIRSISRKKQMTVLQSAR
tara:strand:+ start:1917 stop:2090 length:174 start_codon:yes stop_codon:yes gene_type:complete